MKKISVQLPVLVQKIVQHQRTEYNLRPVFFTQPSVRHRRYEEAVVQLKKEVKNIFSNYTLTAKNRSQLLWFLFQPDWQSQKIKCNVTYKKINYKLSVLVVYFSLQENLFVCLPAFDAQLFALPLDASRSDLQTAVEREVQQWIQETAQSYEEYGEEFNIQTYQASNGDFISQVAVEISYKEDDFPFGQEQDDFFFSFLREMNDFEGEHELEQVGSNLNLLYPGQLKRAYYREEVVEQVLELLYANPEARTPFVLLGEEGVGKHSILQEAVYRYCQSFQSKIGEEEHKPLSQYQQQIWKVDPNRIISGMSIVGMWQKRTEAIIAHLRQRLPDLAKESQKTTQETDKLCVDNIVALLRIGKSAQNSMTLNDVLKPYLEKRQLQMILIATPQEWKIVQERDRRFADLFQVIRIQEPPYEQAVRMLLAQSKALELEHDVRISVHALRMLLNIHRNYFKRRALPGLVSKMLLQLAVKHKGAGFFIDDHEVSEEFRAFSGLNVEIFDPRHIFEPGEVRRSLEQALIGQNQAISALEQVVEITKAKLNNPYRPLASMLFIGPTGVGKTEAAKVLCQYLMGSERKLLRFDMNEYVDEWSVSRLIGDYYNPEGQLTGKIRYNPFGVILLDEIEKAHPKIHDLLLQVLDDARLTDALGRVVDFSNTIIIMTSNIGASQAATRLGFETSQANQEAIYRKAVENFFRPEFINRIDQIVIFQSLLLEHIFDIAKLQIRSLLSRDGFVRRTTILNIEPSALEWVAQRGYDGKMGGRALKRQIERDLTSFTAEQLIQSKNEVPIIFSINLEDGKLNPVVEPLDFINPLPEDWLPEIPQEQQLRKAFSALLEQAQDLHADLVDWEDLRAQNQAQPLQAQDFQENWQYYDFKNRLADLKEHLQRLIISFHSDYFYKLSENALRMKTASNSIIVKRGDARRNPERTLLKDKLFQKSALDELRYVYQHAPEQFSKQQSVYLESLLELHFLELAFNDLQEDKRPDHYWLEISSSISGQGKEEVKFLQDSYLRLFQGIGLGCQARENGLLIEGYGAWSLLEGEVGYHLFYRSHQNPLPIRVQAQNLHDAKDLRQASAKVVRLYDIWLGVEHKGSTITDLRTGLTNHAQITVGEFKLFLYAGSVDG